jgi:hypothetical protein
MSWRGKAAGLVVVLILLGAIAPPAHAELTEKGDLFVRFNGGINPNALPREQLAPISVQVEGTVKTLSGERPPALRQIKIELNRGGQINSHGLPVCSYNDIVAASAQQAMAACGPAKVGEGVYRANTAFPEQDTFPSQGHIIAFNAVSKGHDAILAHIYGNDPVPITRIIVFHIRRSRGTFGTVLTGDLPISVNRYGYVEKISLSLFRRYAYRGRTRSYISAACAAPAGFFSAFFPFARTSMTFEDGRTLSSTLTRSCAVNRRSDS